MELKEIRWEKDEWGAYKGYINDKLLVRLGKPWLLTESKWDSFKKSLGISPQEVYAWDMNFNIPNVKQVFYCTPDFKKAGARNVVESRKFMQEEAKRIINEYFMQFYKNSK